MLQSDTAVKESTIDFNSTTHADFTDTKDIDNTPLYWHPRFNPKLQPNNDVLLYACQKSILLPAHAYPLIHKINGINSLNNIISTISDFNLSAMFITHCHILKRRDLLLSGNINPGQYACTYSTHNRYAKQTLSNVDGRKCTVENASIMGSHLLNQWMDIIVTAIRPAPILATGHPLSSNTKNNSKFISKLPINIIFTDDILNPSIESSLLPECVNIVLKVTGDDILISPNVIFNSKKSPNIFSLLQKRLKQNSPIRTHLEASHPTQGHNPPFDVSQAINQSLQMKIAQVLQQQLHSISHCVTRVNRNTQTIEQHLLPWDEKAVALSFLEQSQRPLHLKEYPTYFNNDGGNRLLAPADTIRRLEPLISPVSGVITHLQKLNKNANSNSSIHTYECAFYKQLPYDFKKPFCQEGFVQTCLGKGINAEQSKASALGEALERHCAVYQGDEPLLRSKSEVLKYPHYTYHQLRPYSTTQYENTNTQASLSPVIFYKKEPIHWMQTWSLTHNKPCYVPLTLCFSNTPFKDKKFGTWNSNGCAAGNTLEEAIQQGLLEVIERDAVALWWYNRTPRPAFNITTLPREALKSLTKELTHNHKFWVLNLTCDTGIPVMAAVAQHKITKEFCFGFGCHFQHSISALRALTELCQLLAYQESNTLTHTMNTPRYKIKEAFEFSKVQSEAYLFPSTSATTPEVLNISGGLKSHIDTTVNQLKKMGIETLALDYSRAHIPLKTVKVFTPGLCHIWPELGNTRLYSAPVTLGWLTKPLSEGELNPLGLFV